MAETNERLNDLINVVERLISEERNGQLQKAKAKMYSRKVMKN
jgi:hypothetical protein